MILVDDSGLTITTGLGSFCMQFHASHQQLEVFCNLKSLLQNCIVTRLYAQQNGVYASVSLIPARNTARAALQSILIQLLLKSSGLFLQWSNQRSPDLNDQYTSLPTS